MANCVYKYKGKEYNSKEELKEALKEEYLDERLNNFESTSFVLEGEPSDLELRKELLLEEAVQQYGTEEFISVEYPTDRSMKISIDGNALEGIASGEKLLFNEDTGQHESFSVPDLIQRERNGEEIPNIRSWELEKLIYYADEVYNDIKNDKIKPEEDVSEDDLKSRLYAFAQKLGIEITTLEDYVQNRAFREGTNDLDVSALADLLQRTIAVSNDQDTNQLTEEVAHFAIEYSKNQDIVNRMLEKVDQTDVYQSEADNYRLKYKNQTDAQGNTLTQPQLEQKVRKEVLGKILANKVQDNFDTQTAVNSAEVGIFSQLKNIWQQFIDLFKRTDQNQEFFKEFGRTLDDLSKNIIEADDRQFAAFESNEVYYALQSEAAKKMHDRIEDIQKRLQASYVDEVKGTKTTKTSRRKNLDQISEELANSEFAQAINAAVSVVERDIENVSKKLNDAEQQQGNTADNLENYDVLNAINFDKNFKLFADTLRQEAENLSSSGIIQEAEKKNILDRLEYIQKRYSSIQGTMKSLNNQKSRDIIKKIWKDHGASTTEQSNALDILDNGYFEDISWIKEFMFPLERIANPIFKAVHALTAKAEAQRQRQEDAFAIKVREIIDRNNINSELEKKLKRGFHMINPQNTHAIDSMFQMVEEEYKEEIQNTTDPQEKQRLQQELQQKMNDMRRAWFEQPVSEDKLQELDNLHPTAKNIILQKSADKKEILEKYRDADGNIRFENIPNKELNTLRQIDKEYKEESSIYRKDGSMKRGTELQVARDLQNQKNSFISQNDKIEYNYKDFNAALDRVKDKAAQETGIPKDQLNVNNSKRLRNWLKNNAIYTYSPEDQEKLNNGGSLQVDPVNTKEISEREMEDILKPARDEDGNVKKDKDGYYIFNGLDVKLPNQEEFTDERNYQIIYDALIEKRRQLVSPFRDTSDPAEINGQEISKNEQLVNTLNNINRHIRKFTVKQQQGVQVEFEGNESFERRRKELERQDRGALENFLHNEAKVQYINGVPVPTAYHYRRSVLKDDNQQAFKKDYYPNFRWQSTDGMQDFYNPNYNRNYSGKTPQLKLDNPELDKQIPKEEVDKLKELQVDVEEGMRYRDMLIDDEFFNLFGIDKENDFWGDKQGATTNKGLWELRQFYLRQKAQDDKDYGLSNKLFQLPQTQATFREMQTKGIYQSMRAQFGLDFLIENDDETLGDRDRLTVPKRYVRKLPKAELISDDTSRLYGLYTSSAANYKYKNKVLPEIQLLRERLLNSKIGNSSDPANSTLFSMLDRWLSVHMYGNVVNDLGGSHEYTREFGERPENVSTYKKVSAAKFIRFIYKYMRATNLGLHAVTPVVGMISTNLYNAMEHLSDNQVSKDSLGWASKKVMRYYSGSVADYGSISPNSHLKKLMEYSNVYIQPMDMYDGVARSRIYRGANQPLFMNYVPTTYISAGQAIFSMFDSYRLVDGKFMNINTFRDKRRSEDSSLTKEQIDEEWKSYRDRSYYNFLTEQEDSIILDTKKLEKYGYFDDIEEGAMKVEGKSKTDRKRERKDDLEDKMRINVDRFWHRIESQATILDKPLMFNNPWAMFAGMHAQYFFNFINHRFSSKSYNLMENRYEEGNYNTMWRLSKEIVTDDTMNPVDKLKTFSNLWGSSLTVGMYNKGMQGLEEFEQTNVKRAGVDWAAYTVAFAFFLLTNAAADEDEDNWFAQYMGLLGSRALLEQGSQMAPTAAYDISNRIKNPIAGQQLLESWMNLPFLLQSKYGEEVERGAYEGMSKRQEELMNMTFIKNVYEQYYQRNFGSSNRYFRNFVIDKPDAVLETIKGGEE